METSQKSLEEVLAEAGNKLLKPPSSVDELLPLLDEVESFLTKVEQSPAKSMHDALSPLIKALVADELLGHLDVDVKVALASCLSEITRITAPDAPYDDDKMKVVFQLIVSSFENLYDESSRSFTKRTNILETVSKVRLCVVMLDLECDGLISEMFQNFLKAIRQYHSGNIFSSMESIMTLVLEESEEISMDLVTILLASVKKENEEIKPIGKRLAERVFAKCAPKLKPYVTHALKSPGISLDEYSKVVTSVLQGTPIDLEHNNDTLKEQLMDVDTKQETCSKDDHPVDMSPKSVTSSGVNGGNSKETETSAKLEDHGPRDETDNAKLTPKSESDDSHANSSMKSESGNNDQPAKEQGKQSNLQTNSAESLDPAPINKEKVTEQFPDGQRSQRDVHGSLVEDPPKNHSDEQKSKGEDVDSLPAVNATVEAAKHLDENKTSGKLSPHKTSEDEAVNAAACSHPSQSLPDEIHEEKPIQQKEDDGLVEEESVSTEITSKKPSEGTSDSEAQPQEDPGIRVQTETSHEEEEAGSMSDLEVKGLKPQDEKAQANNTEGGSSMKKKDNSNKHRRGPKSSVKDDGNTETSHEEEEAGSMSDAEVKGLKLQDEKAQANNTEGGSSMKKKDNSKKRRRGKASVEIDVPKSSVKDDSNTETSHEEEEAGSMSDAEVKGLKPQDEKAQAKNTEVGSSMKKKDNSNKHRRGKASMEIDVPKSSVKDDDSSTETSHEEEEAGSMSDAEVKGLKHQDEKAQAKNTEGGSSMKKKDNSKKRRRGKASMEIDVPKSSVKDDSNKVESSQESPQKSADDDVEEESQRKRTKRKRTLGKDKVPETREIVYDDSLVGSKVKIWWPLDKEYYEGVVESYDRVKKKHKVLYTDGEIEDLNLKKEKWEIVSEALMGESEGLDEPSSPDASAEMHKKKTNRKHTETSSSKHDSGGVKSKGATSKSGRKSMDDEPKSKDRAVKSGSKSKDVTGNKLRNDSGKLKDIISSSSLRSKSKPDITPKTTSKSQQESATKATTKSKGKTPQTSGKPSANGGTGKAKSTSKGKETIDVKEKSTEATKTPDTVKGKASKEQETETKSAKKRKRK